MISSILTEDQRRAALATGIAMVVMTIAATAANDVTIGKLVVERNATETWKNILASKTAFNAGIFSWLIVMLSDVVAAWGLYIFFKPVNKNQSLIAALFRLVYAAMLGAAIFNLVYVHVLIQQAVPSSADMAARLGRDVLLYLNAFDATFSFSLIVFGIHLLLVGILALRSGYVPKIFGIILFIAFAGYAIIHISKLLFPEYGEAIRIAEWIFLFPMVGEIALGIWLLIKGVRKVRS